MGYPLQYSWVFLVGSAGKESTCNSRDLGVIPGLGRSPEEGNRRISWGSKESDTTGRLLLSCYFP